MEGSGIEALKHEATRNQESKVRLVCFSLELTNCKYDCYVAFYNLRITVVFKFVPAFLMEVVVKSSCSYRYPRYLDVCFKVTDDEEYTRDKISFEITGVKIREKRSGTFIVAFQVSSFTKRLICGP